MAETVTEAQAKEEEEEADRSESIPPRRSEISASAPRPFARLKRLNNRLGERQDKAVGLATSRHDGGVITALGLFVVRATIWLALVPYFLFRNLQKVYTREVRVRDIPRLARILARTQTLMDPQAYIAETKLPPPAGYAVQASEAARRA